MLKIILLTALLTLLTGSSLLAGTALKSSQVKCFELGKFTKKPKTQWPTADGQCVASKKKLSCEHKAGVYYICNGETRAMSNKLPEAAFKACNCKK